MRFLWHLIREIFRPSRGLPPSMWFRGPDGQWHEFRRINKPAKKGRKK